MEEREPWGVWVKELGSGPVGLLVPLSFNTVVVLTALESAGSHFRLVVGDPVQPC